MSVNLSAERTKYKAFTLIELLIVLALIGILAAILFPVSQVSRRKARQTTCLNNLRQIGLGLSMYVNDYNAFPPRFQNLWDSGLLRNRDVLRCPEDLSGNRGGELYEALERSYLRIPPETIRYSYHYAIPTTQIARRSDLAQGAVVCQLHGQRLNPRAFLSSPDFTDFEGLILR